MQLSTKIALSFIVVVVLTIGVLLGIIWFDKQNLQDAWDAELKQQIRHRTAEVLQPVYKLCEVKEAEIIPLLQKDLKSAKYLLSRQGGMSLGKDLVPWEIINGHDRSVMELPMMLIGEQWLGQNKDPAAPSPIVDDILSLSGVHCTIYQRVNPQGDMVNVCTSKQTAGEKRAVGAFFSHKNPDGTPNKMIRDVLEGGQYLERASYANGWTTVMGEAIHSVDTGKVIGFVSVGISHKNTVEAVRKIILETVIGKSGYMWVLGSQGERRGSYVISKDGQRDGENLWMYKDHNGQFFVRTIVSEALQTTEGKVRFYRYPWKNPGDPHPRMKISAFTYFAPWDWIIGSSAYEDDFQDPQIRVETTLDHMIYLTLFVGLALMLCSVLVGYFVRGNIRGFIAERERQQARAEDLLEKTRKQARDLEQISNYKSEFLANMSHEIRTPMNAIIGLSHLALQTELSPRQQDYQQKIYASANSLLRLIDDILDFSKVEAGKLDLEHQEFCLEEVIAGLVSVMNVKVVEKGLIFSLDVAESIPPCLVGDSLRLGQVLTNLVSNAVKFTRQGGVRLIVEPVEEAGKEVTLRFTVSDTGIGMSRGQVEQLFEPFYQADASITRKYGGTGLGLAISKRLIEMMGGEMRIDSIPGEGSQFSFMVCFGKTDRQPRSLMRGISSEEAGKLLAGLRVLLVEDNDINMQVARELLEGVGMRVFIAENGREAVEFLGDVQVDVVLMDLQMPVMDGYAATWTIRSQSEFADLPIIAMTANVMVGEREKCLDAGMNDHIPKPIQPSNLYETLIRRLRPDVSLKFSRDRQACPSVVHAGAPAGFSALDGVDVDVGLRNVDGNRELYLKVLASVHSRYRDIVEQIRAEIDRGDFATARRLAHTFKGLAGTIGAKVLYNNALEVEMALNNQEVDRLPALLASFAVEVTRVMTALEPICREKNRARAGEGRKPRESGSLVDMERLGKAWDKLLTCINEGDPEALAVLEEVEDILGPANITGGIRELEEQLDGYEFEDARNTFTRISRELNLGS